MRAWKSAILAYFDTNGASNGPTEATRRIAREITGYRLRYLLAARGHRTYRSICRKVGASSGSEAIAMAQSNGLH
ncbi:hypothetical protein [Arthrobacter sp. PAMC25564]|uniref:hypothetical protein n=1 Tax=Arthrobacter sp. PAMC25564 TaxID=2565366 RepID=UPI00197BDC01|nr:hypothetical protein [Arthrobacter sp. PAMC25564]